MMRTTLGVYDAEVLDALASVRGVSRRISEVQEVPLPEVTAGTVLAEDVRTDKGSLLADVATCDGGLCRTSEELSGDAIPIGEGAGQVDGRGGRGRRRTRTRRQNLTRRPPLTAATDLAGGCRSLGVVGQRDAGQTIARPDSQTHAAAKEIRHIATHVEAGRTPVSFSVTTP